MGDSNCNSSSAADSYIGSLISLTSKSEIRYEGILFSVDTAKSTIALQDVRSFGTEGRKEDGPQIPPSDKVYDYIIFRGTDIKDLQVKSSPAARAALPQQVHQDPAIVSLQAQASPLVPPASNGALPASIPSTPAVSAGSTPNDASNGMPYTSIPSAAYLSSMASLYQPHGGLGSWPIPPGTNGAMPMYWPGFYRPPHLSQPSLYQLPPMMPSNYSAHSSLPPHQLLASQESLPTSAQSRVASLPTNAKDSLSVASSEETSMFLSIIPSTSQKPTEAAAEERVLSNAQVSSNTIASSCLSNLQSMGASMEASNVQPTSSNKSESNKSSGDNRQHSLSEHGIPEFSATRETLVLSPSTTEMQSSGDRPLLPLPVDSARHIHTSQASGNIRYAHRGRGRGRGVRNRASHGELMEEFDFTAMNERFKKHEVWGELGKVDLRERGELEEDTYDDINEEDNPSQAAPVYVKDDFFDTLSCNTLDRGQVERNKFSEQRKLDTETFGRYSVRSHGGRGGRGGVRGGYRGGYYGGRGYANGNRGRFHPRNPVGY